MTRIITAENLGKRYILGGQDKAYQTIRETISNIILHPFSKLKQNHSKTQKEHYWALRNVDFRIEEGDIVGVIGRNGAGKSTLLKLLSRITKPTEGNIKIYGRVASLLEVGTGFHPELTGRENIFLSGNLLGMTRVEVKNKFDEIVEFSGLERFIETPVKHYSSGMYVRLGFAIAAHLEPEILLIDEVLAVGDLQFQKKCLGKMETVSKSGRTIVFVSHSMTHIESFCKIAFLLENGSLTRFDNINEGVQAYYRLFRKDNKTQQGFANSKPPHLSSVVKLIRISAINKHGNQSLEFDQTETFFIELDYQVLSRSQVIPHLMIRSDDGSILFPATVIPQIKDCIDNYFLNPGKYRAVCTIPGNLLNTGTYRVDSFFRCYKILEDEIYEPSCLEFSITEDMTTNPFRIDFGGAIVGYFRPALNWTNNAISDYSEDKCR